MHTAVRIDSLKKQGAPPSVVVLKKKKKKLVKSSKIYNAPRHINYNFYCKAINWHILAENEEKSDALGFWMLTFTMVILSQRGFGETIWGPIPGCI